MPRARSEAAPTVVAKAAVLLAAMGSNWLPTMVAVAVIKARGGRSDSDGGCGAASGGQGANGPTPPIAGEGH